MDKRGEDSVTQSPRLFRRKLLSPTSNENSTNPSQGKVALGEVEQKLKSMRQKRLSRLSQFAVDQTNLIEEGSISNNNNEASEIENAIMSMKQIKEERNFNFKSRVEESVTQNKKKEEVIKTSASRPETPKLFRKFSNESTDKSKQSKSSSTMKFINKLNCTTNGSSIEDLTIDNEYKKSNVTLVMTSSDKKCDNELNIDAVSTSSDKYPYNKPPVLNRHSFEKIKDKPKDTENTNNINILDPLLTPVGKQRRGIYLYDRECKFLENERSKISIFAEPERNSKEMARKSEESSNTPSQYNRNSQEIRRKPEEQLNIQANQSSVVMISIKPERNSQEMKNKLEGPSDVQQLNKAMITFSKHERHSQEMIKRSEQMQSDKGPVKLITFTKPDITRNEIVKKQETQNSSNVPVQMLTFKTSTKRELEKTDESSNPSNPPVKTNVQNSSSIINSLKKQSDNVPSNSTSNMDKGRSKSTSEVMSQDFYGKIDKSVEEKPPISIKAFKRKSLGDILGGKDIIDNLNVNSVGESKSVDNKFNQSISKPELPSKDNFEFSISKQSNYENIDIQRKDRVNSGTNNIVQDKKKIKNIEVFLRSPVPLPRRIHSVEKILKKFQRNLDNINEIMENDSDVDADEIEDLKKSFDEANALLIEYGNKLEQLQRKLRNEDTNSRILSTMKEELTKIETDIYTFRGLKRDSSYKVLSERLSSCLLELGNIKSIRADFLEEKCKLQKKAERCTKILEEKASSNENMLQELLEAQVTSISTNIFNITRV